MVRYQLIPGTIFGTDDEGYLIPGPAVPVEMKMADEDIPPYVRLKAEGGRWCAKFHRPCCSLECSTVCKLAP